MQVQALLPRTWFERQGTILRSKKNLCASCAHGHSGGQPGKTESTDVSLDSRNKCMKTSAGIHSPSTGLGSGLVHPFLRRLFRVRFEPSASSLEACPGRGRRERMCRQRSPAAVSVRRFLLRSRIVRGCVAEDLLRSRGELQYDRGLRQQGAAAAIGEPVRKAHGC